jgi:uncharacterized membrane protein
MMAALERVSTKVEKKKPPIRKRDWAIVASLFLLTLVPSLGGAVRLASLSGGEITPENARFFASPIPVIIHILCALPFCLLGAFQLAPGFRRRYTTWHRRAGRVLVVAGLGAGLTGLWMAQFYPLYPEFQDNLLYILRLVFGSAMVASIALAYVAALRRDFTAHGDWMLRGYAIGQGAGTQAVVVISWTLIFGQPDKLTYELLLGASWVINVGIVELIIRRKPSRRGLERKAEPVGTVAWDGAEVVD